MILADAFEALAEVIVAVVKVAIMGGLLYGGLYGLWVITGKPNPPGYKNREHDSPPPGGDWGPD